MSSTSRRSVVRDRYGTDRTLASPNNGESPVYQSGAHRTRTFIPAWGNSTYFRRNRHRSQTPTSIPPPLASDPPGSR
jgi:hypothetical protein